MPASPAPSAQAKKTIEDLVAEGDKPVFSTDKVTSLRSALQGYGATDKVRLFGATIAKLRNLAWSLCVHGEGDAASAETAYKKLLAIPVSKQARTCDSCVAIFGHSVPCW